ncbi:hypothetical protein MRX96_027729 [Rhipicephalus microplus]
MQASLRRHFKNTSDLNRARSEGGNLAGPKDKAEAAKTFPPHSRTIAIARNPDLLPELKWRCRSDARRWR